MPLSHNNIKPPRDAKGQRALKVLKRTSGSVTQSRLPARSAANLKHCHSLKGRRDIIRIDKQDWEERVGTILRLVEQHRYERTNALYHAMAHVEGLLLEAQGREQTLHEMTVELRRTAAYLKTLMDSMPDMLLVTDPEGQITEANWATERLSGLGRAELIGRRYESLFVECDQAQGAIAAVLAAREISDYDLTLIGREGSAIPVMANATVLASPDGGITGVLINARDVSELKRAQAELELYARELGRANKDPEQFASVASHDLQEPLKNLGGQAQRMAERYRENLDAQARRNLTEMVEQTSHMRELIEGVLSYSRVDADEEAFATTDCEAVFAEALTNLRAAIEESAIIITHDPLPEVKAATSQLLRIFQNLLSNAIKYRDPAKSPNTIHVSAERIERSPVAPAATETRVAPGAPAEVPNGWLFSVRGNGIGIDEEFQQEIFKMFVRLHPRAEYPGSGIGLAIVARIVERHGGTIWVESEPGEGSIFCFTLPDDPSPKHTRLGGSAEGGPDGQGSA